MKVFQKCFLSILFVFFLFTGCSSMTPRYKLSKELPDYNEGNSALLQIPTFTSLLYFDGLETTFSVSSDLMSQGVVQHHFRETLIPPGLHYIIYRSEGGWTDNTGFYKIKITKQKDNFLTAIEFKRGHTYRIQAFPCAGNGNRTFYGWIEELPFMMERRKIKPQFNFHSQFIYWYKQDWKIVGKGIVTNAKFSDIHKNLLEFKAASTKEVSEFREKVHKRCGF